MRCRDRSSLLCALCVLLISGCEDSEEATALGVDATAVRFSAVHRPFRFTLTGNANPDFSQGPCNVTNTESGTGTALHLGAVTWTSSERVDFCVDPSDPGLAEATGELVVTAADGDRLTATYLATVRADFVGGTLTAEGDFVITGGTGRFKDASGGGELDIEGDLLPPFAVAGAFVGGLSY